MDIIVSSTFFENVTDGIVITETSSDNLSENNILENSDKVLEEITVYDEKPIINDGKLIQNTLQGIIIPEQTQIPEREAKNGKK